MNKDRPTWCHLFYYVNLLLNMFRMLINPSSGACESSGSTCIRIAQHQQSIRYINPTRLNPAQYNLSNNTPNSRKLLKMGVLTSETCWTVNWHNKISVIKLVSLYSSIKKMHGPIRIRSKKLLGELNLGLFGQTHISHIKLKWKAKTTICCAKLRAFQRNRHPHSSC